MTALIHQARLDSSRLPRKAMLPLGGKPLIFRVMEALKHINADAYILACAEDSFSAFEPLAHEAEFEIAAGSKHDVLHRYCDAIRTYKPDRIIRATGDNPFVFTDAANQLHEEAITLRSDYAGYAYIPYGAGIESVSAEALLKAEREAVLPLEREHVCPYLYNHPEMFSLHRPLPPLKWQHPEVKISVDTQDDYDKAQKLYAALHNTSEIKDPVLGEMIISYYKELFA
ncbi:MAG: spore coat protein [Treponema sp.]|jgi:spore coat polysaccharide biosynthesis protein SpsF|nr:spore coat protein [Treponema sp.]